VEQCRKENCKLNIGGVIKRSVKEDTKGATKYYIRHKGQFIYGKQNLFKGAFGVVPIELDGYESSSDIPAFDVHYCCTDNSGNRCGSDRVFHINLPPI